MPINVLPAIILGICLLLIMIQQLFKIRDEQNLILALLAVILAFIANMHYLKGTDLPGIYTDFLARLAAGGGLVVLFFTLGISFGGNNLEARTGKFTLLLLSGIIGLMTATASHHLLIIFIGLELISLSTWFLSSFGESNNSGKTKLICSFVYDSVGTVIFLLGISFIFIQTGSLELEKIAAKLENSISTAGVGLFLVVGSLIYRVGILPFHKTQFLEETYSIAPASFYTSIIPRLASFVILIRLARLPFEFIPWRILLLILASFTIIGGNLLALIQENPRKLLVYGTTAQCGYILVGFLALNPQGYSSVIHFLFLLAAMNSVVYGIIFKITSDQSKPDFETIRGFARFHPFLGGGLAFAIVALVGLISTGGFTGKFYLFQSALAAGNPYIVLLALAGSLTSCFYYFRIITYLYSRPASDRIQAMNFHPFLFTVLFTAVGYLFYTGFITRQIFTFIGGG